MISKSVAFNSHTNYLLTASVPIISLWCANWIC